jgi:hypothetical protein
MAFWKPGTGRPGASSLGGAENGQEDGDDGLLFIFPSSRFGSGGGLQKQRQQLPVFKHRKALLYLAENHGTTIVLGETGSGKSTQIPQVGIDCSLLIDFLSIGFSTIFVFGIFFHCHNCSSHDENPNQIQFEADRSRNLQLQRIISIWVQLQISCNTS